MSVKLEAPFSAVGFPPGTVAGRFLRFTSDELAHALFVTGRAPGDRARHGYSSVWEFVHRASLVPAYLRQVGAQRVGRSSLALDLDRSEKVGLSYALGQAMTGIFCRHKLDVPWLMHMDRYARRYNVTFGAGRQRPDLFGSNLNSEWVVAEAKGRSNAPEAALASKLASQKSIVKSIDSQPPKVALGCIAAFPASAHGVPGSLRVSAIDPEISEDALDLDVSRAAFFRAYYEPFLRALELGVTRDEQSSFVISDLQGLRLSVGLDRELYIALTREQDIDDPALLDVVQVIAQERPGALGDGTVVETSWEEDLRVPDVVETHI